MKCVKCNSELTDGAKFCNACGASQEAPQVPPPVQQQVPPPVQQQVPPPQYAQMPQQQYAPAAPQVPVGPQKSRTAYQILALLFGGLGIHNFYAGYVGRGIAQLLLCWTGISGIWAFIEVFVVSKDAKGVPMKPSKLALILLIIILIFGIGGALYGCRGRIQYLIFNIRSGKIVGCRNNMLQYMSAIQAYMNDHRGVIPTEEELVKGKYVSAPASCPTSHNRYVILGSGLRINDPRVPVLIEPMGAHGNLVNFAYSDGSVVCESMPRKNMSVKEIAEYLLNRTDDFKYRDEFLKSAEEQNK